MKRIIKAAAGYVLYTGTAFFCFLLVSMQGMSQNTTAPFSNSAFCKTEAMRIHYRHWAPETEPKGSVLLIHGFAGSTFSWRKTADSLWQCGYEVVAADIPPYGWSDKNPNTNHSATYRAFLLNAFLEKKFPGRQWIVVGHSMGGGIAQAFALAYPERTRAVVFVAGTLFLQTKTKGSVTKSSSSINPLMKILAEAGEQYMITPGFIKRFLSSAYAQEADNEATMGYYLPLALEGTALAILNASRSHEIIALDATTQKVPSLAIWGSNDSFVPQQSMQKVLDVIPGISVSVIEGAGHCPMETHHAEFMKVLLGFLRNTK